MAKTSKKEHSYLDILIADHEKVKGLFKKFEKAEGNKEKLHLAETILTELKVHTTIEEEIVYPAFRESGIIEEVMMDEADEEHHVAKVLMEEIESMKPGDDHYDAKVIVLGEIIEHHADEEEEEIFPKARKSKKLESDDLTVRLSERKEQLTQQLSPEFAESK
jgi:hemerythrin-like domain-containing protein